MRKYRKKAKLAMIATLAISSLSSGINHVLAQAEKEVQENIIEKEEVVEEKARILEEKEESQTVESAAGEVEINDTNFPDYDFGVYIRRNFDNNNDGILSSDELNSVTRIDLYQPEYRGIWSVEGIEHFPNLQELDCYETSITSIDISKNQALIELRISYTDITSIDISQNPGLKILIARDTPLTSIDTSKSSGLTHLLVSGTNITELDVSNNPLLYQLDFYETSITSIDLSKNTKLEALNCHDTQLTSLDVSNTLMGNLVCYNNNLAWLDVGYSDISWINLEKSDSTINLGEIYNTFNIQERFPGIDPNRIMSIEGAEIDKTTGVVSGYDNGTPIRYTYDCGIARGNEIALNVTLNFTKVKRQSSITINDNLDKIYDGQPVADPTDVVKTGTGAVTFEWFRQNEDGSWESLGNQAPINVGNYGVKAHIAANEDYEAADSGEPTPFEITKATSSIHINNYEGKVYDGNPVSDPTDIKRTDNNAIVIFKYYRANDTTTEIPAPSEVGEYKVKAFLSGDANYTDSESDFYDFSITAVGTTITLTYADQIYTGNPVVDPQKDVHYTVEGSTGDVTIEWYEANDLTTPLAQAPTNVGSYVVKVSVEATATHAGASATATFQITQATSTININNYEGKVYDGTIVNNPTNITITGSDGLVTFEWFTKDENGKWASLGEEAPVNAGSYGVKAHLAANQNYAAADSGEPTPFEIRKSIGTVEILSDLNKTYDGEAVKDPSIKVEGTSETATIAWFKKEDDGVTRVITWAPLTSAPVNAGEYKVVVTVAETNNNLGAAAEQEFTIAKAATNVGIEGTLDKEYDGVEVEVPNIKVEGSSGATTIEWYKKDVNGAWELLTSAPKEVGEYKVVVKVEEDENYLSGEVEQTFTINGKVEVPSTPEEGGDNTTTEEEKVEGVQTGDATQTSIWTMLVGLSMSMMYFFTRKKTK